MNQKIAIINIIDFGYLILFKIKIIFKIMYLDGMFFFLKIVILLYTRFY